MTYWAVEIKLVVLVEAEASCGRNGAEEMAHANRKWLVDHAVFDAIDAVYTVDDVEDHEVRTDLPVIGALGGVTAETIWPELAQHGIIDGTVNNQPATQ